MGGWIEETIARNKKQARYDKANTVGFYMKLNTHTDRDIIRWLWSQQSKQGSIKQLIREAIEREEAFGTGERHATIKQLPPEEADTLT